MLGCWSLSCVFTSRIRYSVIWCSKTFFFGMAFMAKTSPLARCTTFVTWPYEPPPSTSPTVMNSDSSYRRRVRFSGRAFGAASAETEVCSGLVAEAEAADAADSAGGPTAGGCDACAGAGASAPLRTTRIVGVSPIAGASVGPASCERSGSRAGLAAALAAVAASGSFGAGGVRLSAMDTRSAVPGRSDFRSAISRLMAAAQGHVRWCSECHSRTKQVSEQNSTAQRQ
mmetsp:Transcript_113688/g.321474  ORF Transcript_113688/g.321474 Transcript_113688/m.321474 type:complete len:228 (-) Transcript_113688:222-905(-)